MYNLSGDHLGTPLRAFDDQGNIVWAADYEAFGKAWEYLPESTSAPTVLVNLRFPGQYLDRETGLHYNWHRYYDPNTGRYLTPDPMVVDPVSVGVLPDPSISQLFAAFNYALANPLRFVDITGLVPPNLCGNCSQDNKRIGLGKDKERGAIHEDEFIAGKSDSRCVPGSGIMAYSCKKLTQREVEGTIRYKVTCSCGGLFSCTPDTVQYYDDPVGHTVTEPIDDPYTICAPIGCVGDQVGI